MQSTYSSSAPSVNVQFGVMLNDFGGSPPFDEQWLELSAPNTSAVTFDVKTDPGCNQTGPRMYECLATLPLSTADMSTNNVVLTARYYAFRSQDNYVGYTTATRIANGVAGTVGTAGSGGSGGQTGSGGTGGTGTSSGSGSSGGTGGTGGTGSSGSGGGSGGTGGSGGSGGASGTGPDCPAETQPMMPTLISAQGTFMFEIPATDLCVGSTWFIDPPVATGYFFTASGTRFLTATAPSLSTVNDPDGYTVVYVHNGSVRAEPLATGATHVFPQPLTEFTLNGIDPSLQIDPADPLMFPMGITTEIPTSAVTITQGPQTMMWPPQTQNQPPVANAGTFVHAVGQSSLTLSGTASSDPDADPLTYQWIQIGGPPVTILGPTTGSSIQTTMPLETNSPQYVVFELVVNDGTVDSAPAQLVVQTR